MASAASTSPSITEVRVNKLDVMEDEYINLVAQKVFRSESMSDVQAQIVQSLKEQVLTEIRNDQKNQPDKA